MRYSLVVGIGRSVYAFGFFTLPMLSARLRDVLAQADFPLRVASQLKMMDASLFLPEPFGLSLEGVE